MKWKRTIIILFAAVSLTAIAVFFWVRRWEQSTNLESKTMSYEVKGLESVLKHNNLDSAIYYQRLATLVPENKRTEDARFYLAHAFYYKSREFHKEYELSAEQKKDTAQASRRYYAYKDSARAVYSILEKNNANPKRLFVLEKLIFNDDDSWEYREKEDKIFRFGVEISQR